MQFYLNWVEMETTIHLLATRLSGAAAHWYDQNLFVNTPHTYTVLCHGVEGWSGNNAAERILK